MSQSPQNNTTHQKQIFEQIQEEKDKQKHTQQRSCYILQILENQDDEAIIKREKKKINTQKSISIAQYMSKLASTQYLSSMTNQFDENKFNQILSSQQEKEIVIKELKQKLIQNNFIIFQHNSKQESTQKSMQLSQNIQLQIFLIASTPDFQIFQISLEWPFLCRKKYIGLAHKNQSFRHQFKLIGIGTYGNVYQMKIKQGIIGKIQCNQEENDHKVVKCLKIDQPNDDGIFQQYQSLKLHFKQFFITDIMSSLQIGPKVLRQNGFDFVIFNKCFQFQLEKCSSYSFQSISQLKKSLFEMHLLRFIHFDIKPGNIMYSNTFKKNVFIDFGISEHIEQTIGEKTFTYFKGTFQFAGSEMKELFLNKKCRLLDLYFNDADMLAKSLSQINEAKNKYENDKFVRRQDQSFSFSVNHLTEMNSSNFYVFESLLYFEYLLYQNRDNEKPNSQLESFLNFHFKQDYQQQYNLNEKIWLFKSGFKFCFKSLKKNNFSKLILAQNVLWGNKNFKQIQIFDQYMQGSNFYKNNQFDLQNKRKKSKRNQQEYKKKKKKKCTNEFLISNFFDYQKQKLSQNNIITNQRSQRNLTLGGKNQKINFQYILLSSERSKKLYANQDQYGQQRYFQMYAQYVSFISNIFEEQISINSKQQVSKVFMSVIQSRLKQLSQTSYKNLSFLDASNQKYSQSQKNVNYPYKQLCKIFYSILPEEQFIVSNCSNLVLSYSFLLSYCMLDQTNDFKQKYLIKILKDTIFLSFKYYKFIQPCFIKYFKRIAVKSPHILITEAITHIFDLANLTSSHYLVSSEKAGDFSGKYFQQIIKQSIQIIVKEININTYDEKLIKKIKILQSLWILQDTFCYHQIKKLKINQQQKQSLIIQIIQQIEKQFYYHQNASLNQNKAIDKRIEQACTENFNVVYCLRAIKSLHQSKSQIDAENTGILKEKFKMFKDILHIQENFHSVKTQYQNLVEFQDKICCSQINFYFFLPMKFQKAVANCQKQVVTKILQLILSEKGNSVLNFYQFTLIDFKADLLKIQLFQTEFMEGIFRKVLSSYISLIDQLKQRKYGQKKVQYILTAMFNLVHQNLQNFRFRFYQQTLKYLLLMYNQSQQSYLNIVVMIILIHLHKHSNCQYYFCLRKKFFQLIFKMAQTHKGSIKMYSQEDQQQNTGRLIFESQIFSQISHPQITTKYWQSKRIKLILNRNQKIERRFFPLFISFIKEQKIYYAVELMVLYCAQIYENLASFNLKKLQNIFEKANIFNFNKQKFCQQLMGFLKGTYLNKSYSQVAQPHPIAKSVNMFNNRLSKSYAFILPIFLKVLVFKNYFQKHQKQWRQVLLKVYDLIRKYPKIPTKPVENLQSQEINITQINLNYQGSRQHIELNLVQSLKYVKFKNNQNEKVYNRYKRRKQIILLRRLISKVIGERQFQKRQINESIFQWMGIKRNKQQEYFSKKQILMRSTSQQQVQKQINYLRSEYYRKQMFRIRKELLVFEIQQQKSCYQQKGSYHFHNNNLTIEIQKQLINKKTNYFLNATSQTKELEQKLRNAKYDWLISYLNDEQDYYSQRLGRQRQRFLKERAMCNKYSIKNIGPFLWVRLDEYYDYYCYFLNQRDQQNARIVEKIIEQKVERVKMTEEYQLALNTDDTILSILQLEMRFLQQKLNKKYYYRLEKVNL